MKSTSKRLMCWVVSSALALVGLTACGGGNAAQPDPTSAKELIERYEKAENKDNYVMDMHYDMDVSVSTSDETMSMTMDVNSKQKGENAFYTMSTDALGTTTKTNVYVTMEDGKAVTYTAMDNGDDSEWVRSETEFTVSAAQMLKDELFDDATFEKTDDGYKVAIKLTKDNISSIMGMFGSDSAGLGDIFSNEDMKGMLEDALDGKEIVYTFNKDCLLTGMNTDMTLEMDLSEMAGMDVKATYGMKIDATVGEYGTVKDEDVTIPEDIKAKAQVIDIAEDQVSEVEEQVDEAAEKVDEKVDEAAEKQSETAEKVEEKADAVTADAA